MLGWLKRNWKTIAVAAVATVAFVAVTAATGGLGAPAMVALFAGGVASGAAGYATSQYLNDQPITGRGLVEAGLIGGVVTVATAGVGRVAAPYLSRAAAPVVNRVPATVRNSVPSSVVAASGNAATAGAFGGTAKVVDNIRNDRPAFEGVRDAVIVNAATGVAMGPAQKLGNNLQQRIASARSGATQPPAGKAPGPSDTRGIVGALEEGGTGTPATSTGSSTGNTGNSSGTRSNAPEPVPTEPVPSPPTNGVGNRASIDATKKNVLNGELGAEPTPPPATPPPATAARSPIDAALERARSLGTRKDPEYPNYRPAKTAGVRDPVTDEVTTAGSGKMNRPEKFVDEIERRIAEMPQSVKDKAAAAGVKHEAGDCAEVKAADAALRKRPDARISDLEVHTVETKSGTAAPRCPFCEWILEGAKVTSDG